MILRVVVDVLNWVKVNAMISRGFTNERVMLSYFGTKKVSAFVKFKLPKRNFLPKRE